MNTQTNTITETAVGIAPPSPGLGGEALRHRLARRLFGEDSRSVCVGRFEVIEMLGYGGMGVVYLAKDPKLDRRVALKLLQPELGDAEGRERLLREALALARLSHPNVVHVYEAAEYEGGIFVAMEYIDGPSLRAWREEGDHPWQMTVEKYASAGDGLAAAHAAGIVHRDFKPSNVLVGTDGRVRVADFGLARGRGLLGADEVAARSADSLDSDELTSPGSRIGTPAYMSPEQLLGSEVDERSDQFSYCVAFWEALFGCRPFVTDEVRKAVRHGQSIAPKGNAPGVPRWLRRILCRGLELRPDARWPSMSGLLDELRAAPARRRRRMTAVTAGCLVIGAWLGIAGARDEPCDTPPGTDEPWDHGLRTRIDAAAQQEDSALARAAAARAIEELDARAEAWARARRRSCEATFVRQTQSAEQFDLSMACFARMQRRLRSTAELLGKGDAFERVDDLLARLEPAQQCEDPIELRRVAPPPDDVAAAVAQARGETDRAELARVAGLFRQGIATAERAIAMAHDTGHDPTIAEALLTLGALHYSLGDYAKAQATLMEAVNVAEASQHDEVAARAWRSLVDTAVMRTDYVHAREWVDRSQAAVDRLGAPPTLLAEHLDTVGFLALATGDTTTAVDSHRRALETLTQVVDASDPRAARIAIRLGNALADSGDFDAAMAVYQQTFERRKDRIGERHPEVAVLRFDIGYAELGRGNLEAARTELEAALTIRQEVYGDRSPEAATTLAVLGQIALAAEDYDLALKRGNAAWAIERDLLPVGHIERGAGLAVVSNALLAKGRQQDALPVLERMVEEFETHPDPALLVGTRINLGEALCDLDRCEEAPPHFQWVIDNSDDETMKTIATADLGRAELATGATARAIDHLRKARLAAKNVPGDVDPQLRPRIDWTLARALAESGAPPSQWRPLAESAHRTFVELGTRPEAVEDLERMLQKRR